MPRVTLEHYMTGIKELDEEHVGIFARIKDMLQIGNNGDKAIERFDEFVLYLDAHYRAEEKYMSEVGFPYLEKHIEVHREIVSKLQKNSQHSRQNVNYMGSMYYLNDLKRMLLAHIDQYDLQVSDYLKERK
jgi:hemerythrin